MSIWNFKDIEQEHDSRLTSVNSCQMPKSVKLVENFLKPDEQWLDIGGGRFDNLKEHFKASNVDLLVYDPYNRTPEHNAKVIEQIQSKKCDGVMINNVLNVIAEKANRKQVILQAHDSLKEGCSAIFLIYEGDKSGQSRMTKKTKDSSSFQMNKKADFFLDEIREVFGNNIEKKGSFLIAKKQEKLENKINELDELKVKSRKLGLKRHLEVGKSIGGNLYVHKNYVDVFPQEKYLTALNYLEKNVFNFDYTIVKYSKENESFSFIKSPDFDQSDEPIAGDSILVSKTRSLKFTKQKTDPQIYHHKWLFVKDDYLCFDVKKSIQRTVAWKEKMGNNREMSSRIGTQSVWLEWLEKNMKNNNSIKPKQ